jgi:hypothetical protein
VRWHFYQPETFELGRELVELDPGISIGLYSAERSIVDAFRLRGREGRDVVNEALRRWLRRRHTYSSVPAEGDVLPKPLRMSRVGAARAQCSGHAIAVRASKRSELDRLGRSMSE